MPTGICKKCGCSEGNACVLTITCLAFGGRVLDTVNILGCAWVDPARTRCSACFVALPEGGFAEIEERGVKVLGPVVPS